MTTSSAQTLFSPFMVGSAMKTMWTETSCWRSGWYLKVKPRKIHIALFPRLKTGNDEWTVKTIETELDVERKRNQKMREWLSGRNTADEGTVQGCVMETVFYDTRQECLQDL